MARYPPPERHKPIPIVGFGGGVSPIDISTGESTARTSGWGFVMASKFVEARELSMSLSFHVYAGFLSPAKLFHQLAP
jgi:hypothetical protein